MNTVTIVGRVGRDASEDFKSFDSGQNKQAEFAADYVKKGRLVAIDGVIANNRWVDKTTNNERENFYIRANTIKLLGSKKDAEEAVL